jgi:hypothetical protein
MYSVLRRRQAGKQGIKTASGILMGGKRQECILNRRLFIWRGSSAADAVILYTLFFGSSILTSWENLFLYVRLSFMSCKIKKSPTWRYIRQPSVGFHATDVRLAQDTLAHYSCLSVCFVLPGATTTTRARRLAEHEKEHRSASVHLCPSFSFTQTLYYFFFKYIFIFHIYFFLLLAPVEILVKTCSTVMRNFARIWAWIPATPLYARTICICYEDPNFLEWILCWSWEGTMKWSSVDLLSKCFTRITTAYWRAKRNQQFAVEDGELTIMRLTHVWGQNWGTLPVYSAMTLSHI